jgi:ATP-dependent Clp protease ATP-binding subunit ClpA
LQSQARLFERFTEEAIQVVTLAREEARRLGHDSVRLEHVFVGLLAEQFGLAAQILQDAGINLLEARIAVEQMTEVSPSPATVIPLAEETKQAMESATEWAAVLGHVQVDTEHVLLALLDRQDPVIVSLFGDLSIDRTVIRARCRYLAVEHATPARTVRQRVMGWLSGTKRENPYSDQAKLALKIAEDRAKLAGSRYAGTDQLLLGIVSGDSGLARNILLLKGISVSVVQQQIKEIVGSPPVRTVADVHFTPMAKRVLAVAQAEAVQRKQHTEVTHIMLGLLDEDSSVVVQILENLNIKPAKLRAELLELLDGGSS